MVELCSTLRLSHDQIQRDLKAELDTLGNLQCASTRRMCDGHGFEQCRRKHVYNTVAGANTVHDGLYIADASVIPGPVAVNPTLTIVAMAQKISGCDSIRLHRH